MNGSIKKYIIYKNFLSGIKEYDYFVYNEKLENMIIDIDSKISISLTEILNEIKDINEIIEENSNQAYVIEFLNYNILIYITSIDKIKFSFIIGSRKFIDIFRKPLKVKKYENPNDFIEIINIKQFFYISQKYKDYFFYCKICIEKSSVENFQFLFLHQNKNGLHEIYLSEIKFNILDEQNLKKFEQKNSFLNKIFKSPIEFEKNFTYYFNYNNLFNEKEEFQIFDDEKSSRCFFQMGIINNFIFGKINYYYGCSGQGKSITLIGTLKYEINHLFYGTFYLNCKTLRILLEKNDFYRVKQIFIDEITYLFIGEYNKYLNVCKLIKNFLFKNKYDFWELIDKILSYCNTDKKKFYIGIDQYNDKNDKYYKLKILEKNYVKNKQFFNFIVFSSMNERDIREMKISNLFTLNNNAIELDFLFKMKNYFYNNEKYLIFEKLGKTLKIYNEMKYIDNEDKLQNYFLEKKKFFLYKIILFYSKNKYNYKEKTIEDIRNIDDKFYFKLLSFDLNRNYSREELQKIIENISFRFFDINNKNSEYIITTTFPLIDEILKDIYKYIILNRDYDKYKNMLDNKESALGTLFKYKVIYNLSPNIINGEINYFENLNIRESYTLNYFVPKSNQTIFKSEIQKKSKIRIGITYIVEKKQFGWKDLDFLIIHMKSEEDIYVYGFKVLIFKSNIFTINELQSSYNLLIDVLKKSFKLNVKKNLMFFGYIFDYSRINDYNAIFNICKQNNLKYVLFNTKNNNFYLNEKETTRDINAITIKVFNEENDIYNNDIKIKNLYDDEYNLNKIYNKKLIYIKDCLNNHLKLKIKSLNFIENTDKITFYENFLYVQFLNDSIYLMLFLDNKIKQYEIKNNEIKEEILILKNKKMNKYEIIFEK